VQRIGRLPEVQERVKLIGGQVASGTPEELMRRVRSDIAKWRDVARRANIQAE
jgi:tripartite-type tricarboxylate transporter receptor subunit TctC